MKIYATFDEDGEILQSGTCQEKDFKLKGPNVVELATLVRDDTHYIENGAAKEKAEHTAELSPMPKKIGDHIALQNLPPKTTLKIRGGAKWDGPVSNGHVLSFNTEGKYTLIFRAPKFKDKRIQVVL